MSTLCDVAVCAVEAATRVCTAVQADLQASDALEKSDSSPVTVADYAAQVVITRLLQLSFPDIPVVGEEDAALLRAAHNSTLCGRVLERARAALPGLDRSRMLATLDLAGADAERAERCWVIDPVDGTKGFLRSAQYAVALCLLEGHEPVLAVVACPHLPEALGKPDGPRGSLFVAERGLGATIRALGGSTSSAITVSERDSLSDCRRCESLETTHNDPSLTMRVAARLGLTTAPSRLDSQCKYALVAQGEVELYSRLVTRSDYHEKLWDHAAGVLLVSEAGGVVTDMHGRPLELRRGRMLTANRGIVASNGRFHHEVIAAIAAELP